MVKYSSGFNAVTNSLKANPFTIAPELGITWIDKKLVLSLLATYNYQTKIDDISITQITDVNGIYLKN